MEDSDDTKVVRGSQCRYGAVADRGGLKKVLLLEILKDFMCAKPLERDAHRSWSVFCDQEMAKGTYYTHKRYNSMQYMGSLLRVRNKTRRKRGWADENL